jgi:glycosyltransferase involved in cell wall biosynthesis
LEYKNETEMKSKRSVLFVSISAPPKNAPESLQAGKYLKYLSQSCEVTLVTSKITGGWRPKDKSLMSNLKDVFKVIEINIWPNKILYGLVKKVFPRLLMPDDEVPFSLHSKKVSKALTGKPDIIYSRSTPLSSHFLAYKLKKHFDSAWVMHLSDPWVDNPYNHYSNKELKFNTTKEQEFFETADLITLTSVKTFEHYTRKYPEHQQKFHIVPNVYDPVDIICKKQIRSGVTASSKSDSKIIIVHTGRLYESRSALSFLQALEKAIKRHPELNDTFSIIFAGFCDDQHLAAFKSFPYSCFTYLGPVSFQQSVDLQNKADVLLAIDSCEVDPRFAMFFPSKLLDYFLSGKMIVGITNEKSTTDELVHEKYGLCLRHHDIEGIEGLLIRLGKDKKKQLIENYSNYNPPEEYNVKINVALLENLFDKLIT